MMCCSSTLPRLRSTSTEEVADAAESLVRQGPPEEQERATWTRQTLAEALVARCDHISSMSHEAGAASSVVVTSSTARPSTG
jgi:hypothetical protein